MRRRWTAAARGCAAVLAMSLATSPAAAAQALPDARIVAEGRFVVLADVGDEALARSLLADALARDSFPGLPRLADTITIAIAPNEAAFRELVGIGAPEWGEAIAFPGQRRIVMRGAFAAAKGGDPRVTLRHEIAHLALHEVLGPGVPRWFDEGYASYAAGEWGREEVLVTSFGLVWRGVPTLAGLDSGFYAGSERAQRSYALAHRAVAELAALAPEQRLDLLIRHWRQEGTFERALRRAHGMSSADFERHFRGRIRRQYGVLAVMTDLSLVALVFGLFLAPLWWQRRRRQQSRLEVMRAADAAQAERERASALAALLGERHDPP